MHIGINQYMKYPFVLVGETCVFEFMFMFIFKVVSVITQRRLCICILPTFCRNRIINILSIRLSFFKDILSIRISFFFWFPWFQRNKNPQQLDFNFSDYDLARLRAIWSRREQNYSDWVKLLQIFWSLKMLMDRQTEGQCDYYMAKAIFVGL